MVQRILDRLLQRLTGGYKQDTEADFCGPTIEEVSSESSDTTDEHCCE